MEYIICDTVSKHDIIIKQKMKAKLSLNKLYQYPLNSWQDGPHSCSGNFGEEEIFLPPLRFEPGTV